MGNASVAPTLRETGAAIQRDIDKMRDVLLNDWSPLGNKRSRSNQALGVLNGADQQGSKSAAGKGSVDVHMPLTDGNLGLRPRGGMGLEPQSELDKRVSFLRSGKLSLSNNANLGELRSHERKHRRLLSDSFEELSTGHGLGKSLPKRSSERHQLPPVGFERQTAKKKPFKSYINFYTVETT